MRRRRTPLGVAVTSIAGGRLTIRIGVAPECPTCKAGTATYYRFLQGGVRTLALWCANQHRWTMPEPVYLTVNQ